MEKHIKKLFNENILETAGKYFDVKLNELFEVGGFENFIYGYEKDNQSYILRISHSSHRTYDQLSSELDFVNYLAQNHANVSVPILSTNQRLVEQIPLGDSYFTVSSYIKAPGQRPRPAQFNENFFYNYGKTVGNLHKLAKTYQPSKGIIKRFNWDDDPLFINAKTYLPDTDEIIYMRFQEIIDKIKKYPIHQDNYGLIHTDIHMGNFFVKDDQLSVFDFDDCSYMWFISDLAIVVFYYLVFSNIKEDEQIQKVDFFMKHFMKGYNIENKLTDDDIESIHDFLKLREILLYIVFYRSTDVTVEGFPKMYIEKYRDRIINHIPFIKLDFTKYK